MKITISVYDAITFMDLIREDIHRVELHAILKKQLTDAATRQKDQAAYQIQHAEEILGIIGRR